MDIFKKLKSFYWPYKRYFLLSLVFVLIVTAITVVYPIVLQITIDDVILAENYDLIPVLAIGFMLLMIVKGIANFTQQYLGDLFGVISVYHLRDALYRKLQRLSFTYYDNARTGDLMSRLTMDVEGFKFFLAAGFKELIRVVFLMGTSIMVMFYYSVPLALVTMAVMPLLIVVVRKFDREVHPAFRSIRKSLGNLNTRIQENVSGMNTIKSLSKEDFEIERFTTDNKEYQDVNISTASIWAKYFPFMEFIGNLAMIALLIFGGWLVMNEQLSLGELVAFFSLVSYIIGPLMHLGFIVNQFSQAKAAGERLLDILEAEESITTKLSANTGDEIKGDIVFDHVTLKYTEEDDAALKNISFHVPQGKVVGLIGSTGAGKSSITQLMTRFYEPVAGHVYIDGKDVADYDLKVLRQHIGFVLQEPFLFSTTIKENIAYGNPDASMEDIVAAAKRSQAHEFIMELPKGYDTMLGERGMGLSGGQRQRISIARALLINPSILVLDDATSAVDMETEFRIQRALKEVMKGRTTFIIAHRISSLKHADEILVLEDGEIVERGVHETLLNNGGPYQRIYDIQYQDKQQIMGER
ncbi:putative ABC transporter ATP-binding protein YknU [Halolactibacillus alkaliphilus]|uniref:Putative ABC transporter ATP-binding protein YknU n=1 Tax=Halolactibacillus alkaliphilus TaxID=442899 RepID=A0A511X3J2_9BACI|nr:ABC transporter ATP-binding protein [Halolactibacillus alkaliphilus]GEN57516.1 putative ABC transporter ATP-binding protein YknU [Halolactibacillus alkaliphilus]GGN73676.1 putative ABC transporter ATP-binding protein YknU [Halolactibacillus alkaliphilus]SFO98048.1 ATP-binding cassette, subfamily B [Halolactibacillus alkaliphilus]